MSLNNEGTFSAKKGCRYYFTWKKLLIWALLLLGLAFCTISMIAIVGNAINPTPEPAIPGLRCPVQSASNGTAPAATPISLAPFSEPPLAPQATPMTNSTL
jgi:hypothetical protein